MVLPIRCINEHWWQEPSLHKTQSALCRERGLSLTLPKPLLSFTASHACTTTAPCTTIQPLCPTILSYLPHWSPPWSPFSALIGAFEFAITPSSRSSQHFEFENVNALYFLFLLFFVSCSYLLLSVRLFTNFSFLMKDFSLKISRRVCTFPASGPHLLD